MYPIQNSYLDECDRERSRHSRVKILRENYLFSCVCPKCAVESTEPDVTRYGMLPNKGTKLSIHFS